MNRDRLPPDTVQAMSSRPRSSATGADGRLASIAAFQRSKFTRNSQTPVRTRRHCDPAINNIGTINTAESRHFTFQDPKLQTPDYPALTGAWTL